MQMSFALEKGTGFKDWICVLTQQQSERVLFKQIEFHSRNTSWILEFIMDTFTDGILFAAYYSRKTH